MKVLKPWCWLFHIGNFPKNSIDSPSQWVNSEGFWTSFPLSQVFFFDQGPLAPTCWQGSRLQSVICPFHLSLSPRNLILTDHLAFLPSFLRGATDTLWLILGHLHPFWDFLWTFYLLLAFVGPHGSPKTHDPPPFNELGLLSPRPTASFVSMIWAFLLHILDLKKYKEFFIYLLRIQNFIT